MHSQTPGFASVAAESDFFAGDAVRQPQLS
jgi:hypothetical protein